MKNDETSVLIRQHIPRWICASIMQMLKTKVERFTTGRVALFIEADVTAETTRRNPEMLVVGFDGPDRSILSDKELRYIISYTLTATTHRDKNDMYAHERTLGLALECFPPCIPVYRYGDGNLDSGSQIGVLTQIADPQTLGHGSPGSDTPVYQSSVSVQYRMDYSED